MTNRMKEPELNSTDRIKAMKSQKPSLLIAQPTTSMQYRRIGNH